MTRELALQISGAPVAVVRRRVMSALFGDRHAPLTVGRFELSSPLGRGAFGTVWRAHDPLLERDVAVKVIGDGDQPQPSETIERFLREARAVAALNSDHVVRVFDCGIDEGAPYYAMELVDGGSLEQWLQREHRAWPQVLEVFTGAAQGLAAAHAAGIVHRDFKPANVLIGHDGRARVADFGLAVFAPLLTQAQATVSGAGLATSLVGGGTPAFMAPEQHDCGPTDARTDVYAFCAALHVGLFGQLPFPLDSLVTLVEAKRHRRMTRAPRVRPTVPRWLGRVVARGLAPDPDERWPSMDAVIAALRPRTRWPGAWLMLAALGSVGLASAASGGDADAPTSETLARARADSMWNDAKRAEVGARLDARPGLSPDIVGRLDRVAREWATARVQACTRSSDVPTEAAPPRVRCLERSAATIAATIDTLATADDKTFDRARELVRSLDDPRRCQQRRPDDGTPAPTDPSRSSVVDPLRQQLMVFGVARKAGRLGAQVDAVEDLVERARAVGFDPVYAEALLMHGRAQQGAGRFEEAAALCEEAYWLAARTAYEPVMVDSALCSTRIRGARLGQTEVALDWARQAEASLERQGWPPEGAARLSDIVAGIHAAQGDTQTALRHHERALEIYATMEVPAPRLWSSALNNYANALADAGRVSEGVEALRRAIPMLARELGPGQPVPTVMRCSLGSLLSDLGEPAAIDELTACVEGLEGNIPADHVWLVQGRANLGLALRLAGQHERAAEQMAEALRGAQTVPGAAGADVRVGIGTNLGDLLLLMGRLDDARERLRVAQRVAHDELGRTDPRTLLAAVKLALVEARSDRAAAVGRLRETLAVATDAEAADGIALTRFELARLVYPDDPAEAGALAHAAREHWRTRPPSRSVIAPFPSSAQEYRDVIDRWWAEHASD